MLPYVKLFGLSLPSGQFFWAIGIIAAQIYYQIYGTKKGYRWYKSLGLGVAFLLFEMIGAKLLYVVEKMGEGDISWGLSGFSFFGIMFSVPLLIWLLCKIFRWKYTEILDFSSVGILFELAFYRIGCMCAGCCRGVECSFGITVGNTTYFPVQPIEAAFDLLIAFVLIYLVYKKKIYPGCQYFLYMLSYGVVRFILEFTRERGELWAGSPFSLSHVWAFLSLSIGAVLFALYYKKGKAKADELKRQQGKIMEKKKKR